MEFYDPASPLKDSWTREATIAYWDARATAYEEDFSQSDLRTKMLTRVLTAARDVNAENTLDIGTGSGRLLFALMDHKVANNYYGVDFSPAMITLAQRLASSRGRTAVTFSVANATHLPFGDGFFGLVVSSMALHHLNNEEKVLSLREILRVLKPGGLFITTDLLFNFDVDQVDLQTVRETVQRTFFPNTPLHEVRDRFRDEPKEWPVTRAQYSAMVQQTGFMIASSEPLADVVSIIVSQKP